jgi:putative hydrolase of the HAD superfamily
VVRAVVFDFFGTLTVPIPAEHHKVHLTPVAEALGCDPGAFHDAWSASFYQRATGAWGSPRESLHRALAHLDLDLSDDRVDAALAVRTSKFASYVELRPETVATLTALRARGLGVGVLSDCTDDLPHLWPSLPIAPLVDATVFSYEYGAHKPDPSLYAAAAERLGVLVSDCLYVGDGGSDELAGAERAGMRAMQIAADGHLGYGHVPWDGPVVRSLTELLAVVDA